MLSAPNVASHPKGMGLKLQCVAVQDGSRLFPDLGRPASCTSIPPHCEMGMSLCPLPVCMKVR